MRLLATIPDWFWEDYCLHSMFVDGVLLFGTLETNRHGFSSAAKWSQGHMNRITLFFFLIGKMRQVNEIHHNVIDRRRELYVR